MGCCRVVGEMAALLHVGLGVEEPRGMGSSRHAATLSQLVRAWRAIKVTVHVPDSHHSDECSAPSRTFAFHHGHVLQALTDLLIKPTEEFRSEGAEASSSQGGRRNIRGFSPC